MHQPTWALRLGNAKDLDFKLLTACASSHNCSTLRSGREQDATSLSIPIRPPPRTMFLGTPGPHGLSDRPTQMSSFRAKPNPRDRDSPERRLYNFQLTDNFLVLTALQRRLNDHPPNPRHRSIKNQEINCLLLLFFLFRRTENE
jgi:hypothetical protein